MLSLLGLEEGDRSSKPESVECSLEVEGRKAIDVVLSLSVWSLPPSRLWFIPLSMSAVAAASATFGKAALHDAAVVHVVSDAIFTSVWWGAVVDVVIAFVVVVGSWVSRVC